MISEKNNNFKVMYDLNLSPTTYDFGHYLVHAEAVRQLTHKNSLIDLTIRADGFRSHTPRDKTMKDDEKWWRIKSIILGCCSILNSLISIALSKLRVKLSHYELWIFRARNFNGPDRCKKRSGRD